MRLINTTTFQLQEFPDEREIRYAILSHRWEHEEVLLGHMSSEKSLRMAKTMKGFYKIEMCCRQAASEGIHYAWVDTCCIDKSSSAELQEAINSMYRWYQCSAVCYAFLSDFTHMPGPSSEIANSQWFRRGWTLQELLAPCSVVFYSGAWKEVGTRTSLAYEIHSITRIGRYHLQSSFQTGRGTPVAEIMSWAKNRKTTRVEDQAYSLLGLFNVYMPMLYGEGNRAFIRLQEELLKQSDDQSLFAWTWVRNRLLPALISPTQGLLSPSPENFPDIQAYESCTRSRRRSSSVTSEGITAEFVMIPWAPNLYLAILNYDITDALNVRRWYGIFLRVLDHHGRFCRVSYSGQDLWSGAGVVLLCTPTDIFGHTKLTMVTVVHRLLDESEQAVAKQSLHADVSLYRFHIDGSLRSGGQREIAGVEYTMQEGDYGFLASFEFLLELAGQLKIIVVGFDAEFSTICILHNEYRPGVWEHYFKQLLEPATSWSLVNRSNRGDYALNETLHASVLEGGHLWTRQLGSMACLKVPNKLGMWPPTHILIDARSEQDRAANRYSSGMLSLRIFGSERCPPTDIQIGPEGFESVGYRTHAPLFRKDAVPVKGTDKR